MRDGELEAAAYARTLTELIGEPERMRLIGAAARRRIQAEFELHAMGARMLANFAKARRLSREWPRQRISEGFARELALQGVEMMRMQDLAEELWPFRQKFTDLTASIGRRGETAEDRSAAAQRELERLESSRAWRAIQAAKATAPYRLLARARFGAGWELADPKEPPEVRLARLRQSRAFRLTQALQRLSRK
jgi:hypothetical protein